MCQGLGDTVPAPCVYLLQERVMGGDNDKQINRQMEGGEIVCGQAVGVFTCREGCWNLLAGTYNT